MSMYNVSFHWRKYKERYNLLGIKCETCGEIFFPLRKICPNCRRKGKPVSIAFSGKGKVYTYTVIRTPSEGFEAFAPFIIGIVELDEGPKVTSQIVECTFKDIYIGMPVETCFRKLMTQGREGIICYGFKFKPTDAALKNFI